MILKPIQWLITVLIAFPFLVAPLIYVALSWLKRPHRQIIYWTGAWTTLFFLLGDVHLHAITHTSVSILWGSVFLVALSTGVIGYLQFQKRGKLLREKLLEVFLLLLLVFLVIDYVILMWYGIVQRLPLV